LSQSRQDVFAGLLSDDFGETIDPELLLSVLLQHGYIEVGKKHRGSVMFIPLKEFTVYKSTYTVGMKYPTISRRLLMDSYFHSMSNRHLYEQREDSLQ